MGENITYVGLDVHKDTIAVALLNSRDEKAIEWTEGNSSSTLRRLSRKLKRQAKGELLCCYEAGPCGYVVQRELAKDKIDCQVVAPSLIPSKPGDRVKTDKRDARKLAELLRGGLLTEVRPPTPEQEAVRDLSRCREDARADLLRCRHRLGKMLLRQGLVYREGNRWTQRHRTWLLALKFDARASKAVLEDYLLAVVQLEERIATLNTALQEAATLEAYKEPVARLRCFRGIDTVSAMCIVSELHGFERFDSPRALMAFVGLTPSEYSSGGKQSRGAITKTGNGHVRRALVEAAWHYRHRPIPGRGIRLRREGQPSEVVSLAQKAERRLCRRWSKLVVIGNKPPQKATVAVARELAGFIWAMRAITVKANA